MKHWDAKELFYLRGKNHPEIHLVSILRKTGSSVGVAVFINNEFITSEPDEKATLVVSDLDTMADWKNWFAAGPVIGGTRIKPVEFELHDLSEMQAQIKFGGNEEIGIEAVVTYTKPEESFKQ